MQPAKNAKPEPKPSSKDSVAVLVSFDFEADSFEHAREVAKEALGEIMFIRELKK
jgi:uncharacterized protein (UPF0212 family)